MTLSEVYGIADAIAPKALSDEYCSKYGAYDNSGVLVDAGEEIRGIVCSLDLSFAAIEKAIETGANLIITHHPAIYGKISSVRYSDFQPLGKKLVQCLKNGISVIATHLNLDGARGGIDESLAEGICLACGMESKGAGMRSLQIMHPLSDGGYGRVYDVNGVTLGVLEKNMQREFSTRRTLRYGGENERICRVASFCGGGADETSVRFAAENGADAIISSDFKHHVVALARESGLCVLSLTHYASENYGFEKFYQKIRQGVCVPCVLHTDGEML